MKKIFLFASVLLLCINNSYGQASAKAYTKFEDRIIDTIIHLPEVKKRMDYVERQTHNKRHLQFTIWSRPTKAENYYWVKVMEDNGSTYYIHFNFFVYSSKGKLSIKFLDTVDDDAILSLDQWRKSKWHPVD